MNPFNAQIKAAIDNFDVQQARDLLREAFKHEPDAETYYLAAQVAINPEQQQSFLEKAVALDPFHAAADANLAQLRATPNASPTAALPPVMPKPQAVAAPASAEPSATDTDAAIRQKIANLQKITRSSVPIFLVGAFGGSFILTLIFALMPGGLYDSSINMHLECRELNTKIMSLGGNPEPCILVDPLPGTVFIGIVMFVLIFSAFYWAKQSAKKELTRLQAQLTQSE